MTLYLYSESQLIVWSFMPPSTTVRAPSHPAGYPFPFFFFLFQFSPFFLIQNASTESFVAVGKAWLISPKISSLPFKIQFPTDFPSNKTIFLYSYVSFYHLPTLQIPWKTSIQQKKKKEENKIRFVTFLFIPPTSLPSPPPVWKEQLHCLQSY